jgi:rod shape-determining protein MreC
MNTQRDDVGIAIRSAFLVKGTKQKFSLLALVLLSILLIFIDSLNIKPIKNIRSFIKDTIYRGSVIVAAPLRTFDYIKDNTSKHFDLYKNYQLLKEQNEEMKDNIASSDFLKLENKQLRKLIDDEANLPTTLLSARVMLDKQSPYLNSFIINIGGNKKIKNGMAVLHNQNFIGRIVDVNFFSSRVLLVTDLNSKIPIIVEPSASNAILSGRGNNMPTLEYLPELNSIKNGDKVYTSGREGIFTPGIPIGEVKIEKSTIKVSLFSNFDQITFINIDLRERKNNK